MGGVQTLSDLLLSSSEKTLNEITLKVLVNLLKIPSNSSMLPRTSSGKAAFVPIMSRLLDPSATQRASAAEIVKLVLQSDIPHHTRNVAQIQQAEKGAIYKLNEEQAKILFETMWLQTFDRLCIFEIQECALVPDNMQRI